MPRRESNQSNELKINDNLSGSVITLYYRMPTTSERQEHANQGVQRQKDKVVFRQAEARLDSGMKILTGVKDGDFERLDHANGEYKPISSKEGSPDYFPGWKEWMAANAGDLVQLLAAHVFEASCSLATGDDIEGK